MNDELRCELEDRYSRRPGTQRSGFALQGIARWLIAGTFGLGVTAGFFYLASRDFEHSAFSVTSEMPAQPAPEPIFEITKPHNPEVKDWETVVEEQALRDVESRVEAPARQTSFNDQNYIPRGADNIVAAATVAPEQQPESPKQRPKEIVVVGKGEKRVRDYCPFAPGSLEHRNCRFKVGVESR